MVANNILTVDPDGVFITAPFTNNDFAVKNTLNNINTVGKEYFRYILPTQVKMGIDGIKYKSIKRPGHICYVLFLDERQATQDDADYDCTPPLCLKLDSLSKQGVAKLLSEL